MEAVTAPGTSTAGSNGNGDLPPELPALEVEGTVQLGLFKCGGKKPTGATLTISGVSGIDLVEGMALNKGDFIRFSGIARVEEVGQRDKVDRKTGVAVDCKQKHSAYATDLKIEPADGPGLDD